MKPSKINIAPGGPEFSRIIHGFWRIEQWEKSETELAEFIQKCFERGITTFDHADIYGDYNNESVWGRIFKNTNIEREEIQLVTKCGIKLPSTKFPERKLNYYDTSKEHIIESAEQSLKKLQTDYIDVLLIHRPDPLMDPNEIADAFNTLKESGKVKYFGVSNFTVSQFDLIQYDLDFPLVTNQIEYSILKMDAQFDGVLDQCRKNQIAPMAWSPLAGGRLFTEDSEQANRVKHTLEEIKNELGCESLDQVALAWIMKHPANICPVLGTGNIGRIESAIYSEKIMLSREQWFRLWTASKGHNVP